MGKLVAILVLLLWGLVRLSGHNPRGQGGD